MLQLLKRFPRLLFGYCLELQPLRAYSIHHIGQNGDQSFNLALHVRVTNKSARDCSLMGVQVQGRKGLVWERINGVICPPEDEPQPLPLHIPGNTAVDFWIRTSSPLDARQALADGRLQLRVEDHTGKHYKQWLMAGPSVFPHAVQM